MSGPLYVPVLPTRPHAVDAYRDLHPDVRARVAPLWTMPARPGEPPDALTAKLSKDVGKIPAVQRIGPAWLDAPSLDESQTVALADALPPAWWALRSLYPVTGPERHPAQQELALASAEHGGGLAVRVRVPGEWNDQVLTSVRDLLDRAGPSLATDLLLDLGPVLVTRPDAAKEAVRALDALVPIAPWRTIAVASGGTPARPADFHDSVPCEVPRQDWETWQEIHLSGRPYLHLLRHGDYGILPAVHITRPPSSGKGPPAWGVLRYTTDRSYLIAKMLHRGGDRRSANQAAVRRLTHLPEFRGPSYSVGESWLCTCASGRAQGNQSTWHRAGNTQHMTFVAHRLNQNPPG